MFARLIGLAAGIVVLALGVAPSEPHAGEWQATEIVAFTDFDDLKVKRDGKVHNAFLVGLRPIREAPASKQEQEDRRNAVRSHLEKSELFAQVVTRRGDVLGLSIDAFAHRKNCFDHAWDPNKYPYCWSGWGAYNFNIYFLHTGTTTFQDNFGENKYWRQYFSEAVKGAAQLNREHSTTILHGAVKDELAAFLVCPKMQFTKGEPIALRFGLVLVGPGLDKQNDETAKLRIRVFKPESIADHYSWFQVTGPDGQNVPYHGVNTEFPLYEPSDDNSVVLRHSEFLGRRDRDLDHDGRFDLSKPGRYKVRWRYGPHGADGVWSSGPLTSNEIEFQIADADDDNSTLLLPKRLSLGAELVRVREDDPRKIAVPVVRFRKEDAEQVTLPVRNGHFMMAQYYRDGEFYRLSSPPKADDVNAIDHLFDYKGGARKVSYTIEVFETAERPHHLWHPDPASPGYKVLWKKTFGLSLTAEQIKRALKVTEDDANHDVGVADPGPLILEARAGMNVTLEVTVSAGSDFRVASTVKGQKWTFSGTVHKVDDDVATVSGVLKYSNVEDYSSGVELSEKELKINDLGSTWGSGSWGGINGHFWIRRGVDPVPALKNMLARRDDTFWHAAWYATELGGPKAREAIVPDLIDALKDGVDRSGKQPSETIRVIAAKTLGQYGATAKPAVPALMERLKDDNVYVRIAAAVALWKIKRHAAAVPALIAELQNDAWGVRFGAVGGLGEIAAKKNAATVVSALTDSFEHDEHTSVRLYAARTLAKLGARAESAVPALTKALDDESKDIQQDARRAIDAIRGRNPAPLRGEENKTTPPRQGSNSAVPTLPDPLDAAASGDASANEVRKAIFERRDVARNRIPDLVNAYRARNNLPALERYLDELLTKNAGTEASEERREVIKRVEIAREYIVILRMAERGDAAGLWAKIDLPWFGTAMSPIGPLFDFDRSRHATNLLLSLGEKAKPLLLSTLEAPVAEDDPILKLLQQMQVREERRLAIVLLGRLKSVEVLPVIRSELMHEPDEDRAVDLFYAALCLGTDGAIALANDNAARSENSTYRRAAKRALKFWKKQEHDK